MATPSKVASATATARWWRAGTLDMPSSRKSAKATHLCLQGEVGPTGQEDRRLDALFVFVSRGGDCAVSRRGGGGEG